MYPLRKGEFKKYNFSLSIKTHVSPKLVKIEMIFSFGAGTTLLQPHTSLTIHQIIELGSEDLSTRVLTIDSISGVSQYNFNTKDISVSPKHVKLPNNKKYYKGIARLETITVTFKMANTTINTNIIEIRYKASRQAIKKGRK